MGLFRKKKKKDQQAVQVPAQAYKDAKKKAIQRSIDDELDKEKKRNREKEPNWGAIFGLFVCFLTGIMFWVYGQISQGTLSQSLSDLKPTPKEPEASGSTSISPDKQGVIIFEKK